MIRSISLLGDYDGLIIADFPIISFPLLLQALSLLLVAEHKT